MEKPITAHFRSDGAPLSLEEYESFGGYQALRKALTQMEPTEVTKAVLDSGLAGRGGAGFPAGRKWGFVDVSDEYAGPRFLVANADEMEPGAFKDRFIMEGSPHHVLEGMMIAAYAIRARTAYLFIRAEYARAAEIMRRAIAEAQRAGYLGTKVLGTDLDLDIRLHVSAGRYICGEASAMLNALEGERPIPRHKPPHQTSSGLWSKPTVVNNVETLAYVPAVVANGAQWFKDLGLSGEGGMKIYTVSGRVKRPGAWELPLGTTIEELLEEHAGGMRLGLRARAALPGGGSTGFVPATHFHTRMDDVSLSAAGSRLGTGTLILLDEQTCPVGMLRNLEHFYAQESCGWCTPCWQGLHWVEELLAAIEEGRGTPEDLELLDWHVAQLKPEHTFCDLAPGAMEPLGSALVLFREDFVRHIEEGGCPWMRSEPAARPAPAPMAGGQPGHVSAPGPAAGASPAGEG
jgi:NADH-quinone oxidoreductase subunit F